jgi:serine/threonine protein kinase
MGQGQFGIVYDGLANLNDTTLPLALKYHNQPEALEDELNNSNALIEAVSQKLKQGNSPYGLLSGMGVIVTASGVTASGVTTSGVTSKLLIFERIPGKNLQETVSNGKAPYNQSGFPNDPQKALICAASLFMGLAALHSNGFVHFDIKPPNIMQFVDPDDASSYFCRIIDLGAMKKSGEKTWIYPYCIAPEYASQVRTTSAENSKLEKLQQECYDISLQMRNTKNTKNSKKIKKFKQTLKKIEKSCEQCNSLMSAESCFGKIGPQYDIYLSAVVFPILLFGNEGLKFASDLYKFTNPQEINAYLKIAQQKDFNAQEYFYEEFAKLNQSMESCTKSEGEKGRCYPQCVLTKLAELQSKMSALNPQNRPSAVDMAEVLQDLGLTHWPRAQSTAQSTAMGNIDPHSQISTFTSTDESVLMKQNFTKKGKNFLQCVD